MVAEDLAVWLANIAHPVDGQRAGQWAVNTLPERLHRAVSGSVFDAFHDDGRLPLLIEWAKTAWPLLDDVAAAAAKERADVVAFLLARSACRAAERDAAYGEGMRQRRGGAAADLSDAAEEVEAGNHARPGGGEG